MARRRRPWQIVVAGAGPVGLVFALELLRQSRTGSIAVRIVDARAPSPWQAATVDPRVYALSRESQVLLGDLWPAVIARRASPYRRMRVFEGATPATGAAIDFSAADIGEPDLGHIVEDSLLRTVLLERLHALEVETSFGAAVETLAAGAGGHALGLDDGTRLTADVVIGADGGDSRVRAAAGIDIARKDYGQRAIVCHVETAKPHAATAWQRFLPDGPLALLPLADGRSSIVWTLDRAQAETVLALDDAAFLARLAAASAGVLGAPLACSPRLSFALEFRHAARYTRPGVVLIGDAAHTVHPLAGQGMNLGFRDAGVLAGVLARAVAAGECPADEFVLRRYARAQRAHNLSMQLAFDGLNELFGRRTPVWAAPLRAFGLAAVDRSGPAKRLLMRHALGLDRRLAGAFPNSHGHSLPRP